MGFRLPKRFANDFHFYIYLILAGTSSYSMPFFFGGPLSVRLLFRAENIPFDDRIRCRLFGMQSLTPFFMFWRYVFIRSIHPLLTTLSWYHWQYNVLLDMIRNDFFLLRWCFTVSVSHRMRPKNHLAVIKRIILIAFIFRRFSLWVRVASDGRSHEGKRVFGTPFIHGTRTNMILCAINEKSDNQYTPSQYLARCVNKQFCLRS